MRQTRALHDLPQKDSVKSGLINPCTVPPQGIPGLPNIVPYFTNYACVRQFSFYFSAILLQDGMPRNGRRKTRRNNKTNNEIIT